MISYAAVIDKAAANYSTYGPDLPGCIATGFTLDGLREEGLPIPEPTSRVEYVEA